LRADKFASAEATALVTRENDKKKSNSMKVKSSKSMKRGADRAKQKFLATSANSLVIGLRNVLKSSSMQGTQVVNPLQGRTLMQCGLQEQALSMRTAGTVTALQQDTLRLANIIFYHTQNLPILKRLYLARKLC
jgi:hypothetical protein